MATHVMECSEPWYSHLRDGRKTVEGRKATEKWRAIKPGDTIVFRNGRASFDARVTGVAHYPPGPGALARYLNGEGLEKALPGVGSLAEGEAVYLRWWAADEIDAVGMLGIRVARA